MFVEFFFKELYPLSLKSGLTESMNTKISIKSKQKKQSTKIKTDLFLKVYIIRWCKSIICSTNNFETGVFQTLGIKFTWMKVLKITKKFYKIKLYSSETAFYLLSPDIIKVLKKTKLRV